MIRATVALWLVPALGLLVAIALWAATRLTDAVERRGLARRPLSVWRSARGVFQRATGITVAQTLHIFALSALAVAQPLFDVVSREPTFFVARNTTATDLAGLLVAVCIALPTLLVLIVSLLARLSTAAANAAHAVILAVLGGAMLMPLLKQLEALGALASISLALLLAGFAVLAYRRHGVVRSFLTALSFAVIVVPAAFLMDTEVRGAVVRTDAVFPSARVSKAPPIVFVVFDEFPITSLMDRDREIDSERYPNFARLAATATWYRNASTVSSQTTWAVPAIASGIYPVEPNAVPTRRYFPNNLFTMLAESYQMTVFGRFLQLCPANRCAYDLEVHDSLDALIADLGIVYLHIISPDSLAAQLPPIVGDWRAFAARRRFRDEQQGERRRNERSAEFDRFLETMTAEREGWLHFLHTLTPHMPFEYVPSGHRYRAKSYQGHREGGHGLFQQSDPWLPVVLQQRHLLQVGFVDRLIGQLLDRLEALGIYDAALIIITADHGASFQQGMPRRSLTPGTRADVMLVPLIIKYPGQSTGYISDENVETVDIVPTIASVLSTTTPYDVDGRSLLDSTRPQRTHKVFVQRNAARTRIEEHEAYPDDRYASLKSKLVHFESGLYALGLHASIVGRPLSSLSVHMGTESVIRLENPAAFDNVDIDSNILPLFVRGVMMEGAAVRVSVAVAVNGIVVATTQSYLEQGEWVLASMIPEDALKAGTNDLQVFIVDEARGGVVLTLAASHSP